MRTVNRACLVLVISLVFGSQFLGCSFGYGGSQGCVNKYLKSTGTVQMIGVANARESKLCNVLLIPWDAHYGQMLDKAINKAIQKGGGNILLNYTAESKMTTYFLFSVCTISVSGMVGKGEIENPNELTEKEMEMHKKYLEREEKSKQGQ
jgi:hypothetical protein